jgi:hypothetical protein
VRKKLVSFLINIMEGVMAAISRKPLCFFAVLCIVSALASQGYAAEMTVFGPTQYVRTTGAPDIYNEVLNGKGHIQHIVWGFIALNRKLVAFRTVISGDYRKRRLS